MPPDDLDERHDRHRVHEVHADDAVRRAGRRRRAAVIEIDDVFEAKTALCRTDSIELAEERLS